jgi:hypothetical protein
MYVVSWRLLVFWWLLLALCCSESQRAEADDRSCVVYFEKNVLPPDPGIVACRSFLSSNSCFAWLQPLWLAGCGDFPSFKSQLQEVGTLSQFCFSGYSWWLCPPSHTRQRWGYLQCTHIWPKRWHLKQCVSPFLDLWTLTFIIILQSDVFWMFLEIFYFLQMLKRIERFKCTPPSRVGRLEVICFVVLAS